MAKPVAYRRARRSSEIDPNGIRAISCAEGEGSRRPNVLLITIDDMNDGITLLGDDRPFKTHNIQALANATASLPISIAGLGFFEAAFVMLYGLVGVVEHDALAACIGYRLCTTLVAASGGVLAIVGRPLDFDAEGNP